jgi:hypothetical protein
MVHMHTFQEVRLSIYESKKDVYAMCTTDGVLYIELIVYYNVIHTMMETEEHPCDPL